MAIENFGECIEMVFRQDTFATELLYARYKLLYGPLSHVKSHLIDKGNCSDARTSLVNWSYTYSSSSYACMPNCSSDQQTMDAL